VTPRSHDDLYQRVDSEVLAGLIAEVLAGLIATAVRDHQNDTLDHPHPRITQTIVLGLDLGVAGGHGGAVGAEDDG
jgi:hypothetical protein